MNNKNIYYNGINGLLKSGVKLDITEKEIKTIYKCKQDPLFFINNFYYIINQEKGEMLIKLYDYQEKTLKDLLQHKRIALNWARQASKSTIFCAFCMWFIIFNKNKNAFLLANKLETSKELLERIKFAYLRLPLYLQPGITEFNKQSIVFGNGSKIFASTTTPDSIRGKSASLIIGDEISFCDNWQEFWSGISPTIATNLNSYVCLASTPSGFNHWWSIVESARNGTNGFKLSEITWDMVPGRDEKWAKRALEDLNNDEDMFAREYDLQFLGASGCLISSKKLKAMPHKKPLETRFDNKFKIYKYPKQNKQYYMICDYSEGLEQDDSTIQIFSPDENYIFRQCAVYKDSKIKPREFASIKNMIGEYYNGALIIGESNSIGLESLNELFEEYEYENIYFDIDEQRKIGLKTTKKTKKLGNSYLKKYVENDKIEIVDFDTINQLSTYVRKGNSYEADTNCKDDLVTPLVMFSYLINHDLFNQWYIEGYNMRDNDDKIDKDDVLPLMSTNNDRYDDYESLSD